MLETYLVPAAQKDSRRIMVVLHGLGDSVDGYAFLPQAMQLAWLNYALVNAPDPYYQGYSWYDFSGKQDEGVHRSRGLLFQLLDHLCAQGFPTENTVLFGFSQGCLMTLDVGLRYPKKLAGLIGISGYVHQPEELLREMSKVAVSQQVLVTHGLRDPLVPIAATRDQISQLRAAGIQIDWREFDKAHTIAGVEELEVIRQFVIRAFA